MNREAGNHGYSPRQGYVLVKDNIHKTVRNPHVVFSWKRILRCGGAHALLLTMSMGGRSTTSFRSFRALLPPTQHDSILVRCVTGLCKFCDIWSKSQALILWRILTFGQWSWCCDGNMTTEWVFSQSCLLRRSYRDGAYLLGRKPSFHQCLRRQPYFTST